MRKPKGWEVTFFAGTIPLTVGITLWFCTMWSVFNPDQPWLNPTGPTGFSYGDLFARDPKLAGFMSTGFQVGFTNLTATGIFMCSISIFALRYLEKWSWWVLLFAALWIGGNDSATTVMEYLRRGWDPLFVIPLAPTFLTLVGLAIDYGKVFAKN
jgi:hypothetical protein